MPEPADPSEHGGAPAPPVKPLRGLLTQSWLALGVGAAVVAICFDATGGLSVGTETAVNVGLTLASGALVALALLTRAGGAGRIFGIGAAAAFLALAAFTALSIAWSVQPNSSWIDANQTFAYAATFAGAVALVRIAPTRWRGVLFGLLLGTVFVTGYSLATKVFPGAGSSFARLNAPFDYWNAVGLTAALGLAPALWLAGRRDADRGSSAGASALICLLLVAIVLSYSRGSIVAAAFGVGFWFALAPVRLRSLATFAIGCAGAAIVIAWTLSQHALTTDNEPLAPRTSAGHELGLLLAVVLIVCAGAGLALHSAAQHRPLSVQARRRIGLAVIVVLALVPVAGVVALAASSRGLTGSISHEWSSLTNTHPPGVANNASRLGSLDSSRALYWDDALKIWRGSPVVGSGAGGYGTAFLRYARPGTLVADAHSYVFQTLADLGLVGIVLSLLLATSWGIAALRTVRRKDGGGGASDAERIGLLALIACVVTFAVHSALDFTWFVPGDAFIGIVCAGWVAGRGPTAQPLSGAKLRIASPRRSPLTAGCAGIAVALALLCAWAQWQPLRSLGQANAGLAAAANHRIALAIADERDAGSIDPLDYEPELNLAYIDFAAGRLAAGHLALERAVQLQPSNAYTWAQLAAADLQYLNDPGAALRDIGPALHLYPTYPFSLAVYRQAVAELNRR